MSDDDEVIGCILSNDVYFKESEINSGSILHKSTRKLTSIKKIYNGRWYSKKIIPILIVIIKIMLYQ